MYSLRCGLGSYSHIAQSLTTTHVSQHISSLLSICFADPQQCRGSATEPEDAPLTSLLVGAALSAPSFLFFPWHQRAGSRGAFVAMATAWITGSSSIIGICQHRHLVHRHHRHQLGPASFSQARRRAARRTRRRLGLRRHGGASGGGHIQRQRHSGIISASGISTASSGLAPSCSRRPSAHSPSIRLARRLALGSRRFAARAASIHRHPSPSSNVYRHPSLSSNIHHTACGAPLFASHHPSIQPSSHPSPSIQLARRSVLGRRVSPRSKPPSVIIHPTSIIIHHAAYGVPLFASHHPSSPSSSHLSYS